MMSEELTTSTPIFDQLLHEKQKPVYFIAGSESGYIATDGISIEAEEDEQASEWWNEPILIPTQTASFEFRFTQKRRERIRMLKILHPGRYRFGKRPLIHNGGKAR